MFNEAPFAKQSHSSVHTTNRNMNHAVQLLLTFCLLVVAQASVAPEFSNKNDLSTALKMGTRPTCQRALSKCIKDLDSGKATKCDTLPIPPSSFVKQFAPGTFEVRKLRSGVWMYNDGIYLSLILKKGRRLVIIDFPDSAASNTDTGSGTLLTDAIEKVLGGTIPNRIDMVYSHAHLDHIGSAKRVYAYAKNKFPSARLVVWGTQETKKLVDVHTSDRAAKVTAIVKESGKILKLSRNLEVQLIIVGGHTQQDLVIFIPKSTGQKGIAFYVDVVFPGWSPPFNLAITQDVREMIGAQKEILKLDFDILVPGHLKAATKKDIRLNVAYLQDLVNISTKVLNSITLDQLAAAGIGKVQDPKAREYRNIFYGIVVQRDLEIDVCYRALIEKWGCRLASLDLFLRGHCFIAITFALTDI